MLDLVEQGSTLAEVIALGKALEAVGVTLINTGIGWHEARIPTIATSVPRGAFSWVTAELKKHLTVPSSPPTASTRRRWRSASWRGEADMVSMARPSWRIPSSSSRRPKTGRTDQHLHRLQPGLPGSRVQAEACLLSGQPASLLRDRAHPSARCPSPRSWLWWGRVRRVGIRLLRRRARPSGEPVRSGERIAASSTSPSGSGQGGVHETLRCFARRLEKCGVELYLGQRQSAESLLGGGFDEVISPPASARAPQHPGDRHPKVLSYLDVLRDHKPVGEKVAVIGAGGIGFDVAEYLVEKRSRRGGGCSSRITGSGEWGIDRQLGERGGLMTPGSAPRERQIWLLQRKESKVGMASARPQAGSTAPC